MLFPTELEVRARDNKTAKNEAEAKESVGGIKEGEGCSWEVVKWRRRDGSKRIASRYKPINKMIRSRCNDVSNKIRGKLQTTPSQFSFIPV